MVMVIAAYSAYDMFSWYKYLIVKLVFFPHLGFWSGDEFSFSHLGFWSGDVFLIAPFSVHCLLLPS